MKNNFTNIKQNIKSCLSIFFQGLIIASLVIFVVCPISCKITTEGISFINGDYVSPKLLDYKIVNSSHIKLIFSEDVELNSVVISELTNNQNNEQKRCGNISSVCKGDEIGELFVETEEKAEIGKDYVLGGVVKDLNGNSLTFSLPFKGYNDKIPGIIMTEIQPTYAKKSGEDSFRSEFIKFKVLEDGNLFGLMVGSATNGQNRDYYFPALEVKKGDIIVVHFRKLEESCIDELGDDLNLSKAPNSCFVGRDLWLNNDSSVFTDSYDIIYLKDTINNKIIDGFMYTDKKKKVWPDKVVKYAEELAEAGIFPSASIDDAFDISKKNGNNVSPTVPLVCTNVDEIVAAFDKKGKVELPIKNSLKEWHPIKNNPKITAY